MTPRKKIASLVAVVVAASILFGGTFAWQSISQEALNEIRGGANPGGRLHDDFNNVTDITDPNATRTYDKDVYVENFTTVLNDGVPIYARIRLDEYMEIGTGAGTNSTGKSVTVLDPLNKNPEYSDRSTWTTFIPGQQTDFRDYWEWDIDGGQTTYMPTFNKNKDSLAADINGTSAQQFSDYVDYSDPANATRDGYAIYDADEDLDDELTNGKVDLTSIIKYNQFDDKYKNCIYTGLETHNATQTIDGYVITMKEYDERLANGSDGKGNYWVWDEDGWAYWANPIMPSTATGLLLSEVKRTTEPINTTEWYYGINVVAQFITADDLGNDDDTGFYDSSKWSYGADPNEAIAGAPTESALRLLSNIGVITNGASATTLQIQKPQEGEASDEDELYEALETGGGVTLLNDIPLSGTIYAAENAELYLEGNALYAASGFYGDALLYLTNDAWVDIEGGYMSAPEDGYAVIVDEDAWLHIWDGDFAGSAGAIYVENGEVVIYDGEFYLQDDGYGQLIDWNQSAYENGDVDITIFGGTFYNFDPSNVNGVSLLPDGYRVIAEEYGEDTIYTVIEGEDPAEKEEEKPEDELNPDDENPEGEEPGDGETTGDGTGDGETTGDGGDGGDITGGDTAGGDVTGGSTTEGGTTEGDDPDAGTTQGGASEDDVTGGESTGGDPAEGSDTTEGSTSDETAGGDALQGGTTEDSTNSGDNSTTEPTPDGSSVNESTDADSQQGEQTGGSETDTSGSESSGDDTSSSSTAVSGIGGSAGT